MGKARWRVKSCSLEASFITHFEMCDEKMKKPRTFNDFLVTFREAVRFHFFSECS